MGAGERVSGYLWYRVPSGGWVCLGMGRYVQGGVCMSRGEYVQEVDYKGVTLQFIHPTSFVNTELYV